MNIAIFTPSQNSYSETFIQAQKNYLKENVFFYYGKKGSVQLEGSEGLVSKPNLWRYRFLRKLNKYPFSYINERSLLMSLRQTKIDVILVQFGTHAFSLRKLLNKSNLPVVVHFHGYDASVRSVIDRCDNYKSVFALASKVIAVSKKMEQMLLELGCPKDKLVYNVYGPRPEFEIVQPTFAKKQFIGIGRFTDKKAPYYTITAFKDVVLQHPNAKLLLAGDGVLLNTCKNIVKYYGLENKVEFLGVVTPELYRQLLAQSLAFVQHSIIAENGDMEGTPLAVLEASVAGLPIISTNHAGIPDVVIHGETGLLCNEHDVITMAAHMQLLVDDTSYARKLGSAGKEHILKNYNLQRHIDGLQALLENVVTS